MKKCLYLIFSIFILPAHAMEQPKELTLFEACEVGDVARVRELIKAGVSVDNGDGHIDCIGQEFPHAKALMAAAHEGHLEIVLELLKAGAHIHERCSNRTDQLSLDAFCFAVIAKRFDVAEALLQAGANINKSVDHATYSHLLAKFFDKPVQQVSLLVFLAVFQKGSFAKQTGFLVASGARLEDVFEQIVRCNVQSSLNSIICNSFSVPSDANVRSSAHKIKNLLLCFKRFAVPRDVRNLLLFKAVPNELISLLAKKVSQKKPIPSFALDLMADACYQATAGTLLPQLKYALSSLADFLDLKNKGFLGFKDADAAIVPFLDPANFEENYGEQLRANIRARLANPYWFKRELLGLEHTSVTKEK